ncbi:2Fe-2S iron-sulfur cluster binding domain-containing protein [Streptomyces sp. 4503]|uniref:2Fe-2S iron-sulfur cluster binding domain-containing protein n=1 Tax=Streptomyces niphimycinicus TaxID=2842201 RepID=A0ABS6CWZ7_9ACTN|nr:2Fe-2S iron-sulfur cluster-binding protein [Streptomyces niphimycinicus]MBU3871186.1 2Fe-2S iron-sulfur cluster binding domain-containing protein [Streptomyces niphimycinicus]
MRVNITVNGRPYEADDVWEGESLLYVLRERMGLPGSKNACEQGECGSCTVRLDGVPVCACLVAAGQAEGREVVTVEGLADHARQRSAKPAGAVCPGEPEAGHPGKPEVGGLVEPETGRPGEPDTARRAEPGTGRPVGPDVARPVEPGLGHPGEPETARPRRPGSSRPGQVVAPLAPVQQAFIDAGAVQCGFCTPGLLVAADELLERTPDPSDADIREALSGNLCRCTGYEKILDAVRLAAARTGKAV